MPAQQFHALIGRGLLRAAAALACAAGPAGCDSRPATGAEEPSPPQPQAIATVAEWPLDRGDPGLRAWSPGNADWPPREIWSAEVDGAIAATPVIADGRVVVATLEGKIAAFELHNGNPIWSVVSGGSFAISPTFYSGRLLVGNEEGIFFCLAAEDGAEIWRREFSDRISAAANVAAAEQGGTERALVIFPTYDGTLHALDAASGEPVWSFQTESSLNASAALAESGVLAVGGCDGILYVLEPASGRLLRAIEVGTFIPTTAPIAGNVAYAGTHAGTLHALDIGDGRELWLFAQPRAPFPAAPAIAPHAVIAVNRDGFLYAIVRDSGDLLWRIPAGRDLQAGALAIGDTALVVSVRGVLLAVDIRSGDERWRLDLGARIDAAPAVAGNLLLLGDRTGRLTAFQLGPAPTPP